MCQHNQISIRKTAVKKSPVNFGILIKYSLINDFYVIQISKMTLAMFIITIHIEFYRFLC